MEVETAVRTRRRGCRGPEVTLVAAAAPVGPHQAVPRDPGSISMFPFLKGHSFNYFIYGAHLVLIFWDLCTEPMPSRKVILNIFPIQDIFPP